MNSKNALQLSAGAIVTYWSYIAATRLLGPHRPPPSPAALAANVCVRSTIVIGAVWLLLRLAREPIRELDFTVDRLWPFAGRTLLLSAGLFVAANVVLNSVFSGLLGRGDAPPIADLFRNPHEAPYWIFSAILGGGIAEELTRAFVLTRFEKLLGRSGLVVAILIDSVVFGLGHLYQGRAAAVTAGFTGLAAAMIFLSRRRVIDAMAVHAVFDLMGIAAAYALYAN